MPFLARAAFCNALRIVYSPMGVENRKNAFMPIANSLPDWTPVSSTPTAWKASFGNRMTGCPTSGLMGFNHRIGALVREVLHLLAPTPDLVAVPSSPLSRLLGMLRCQPLRIRSRIRLLTGRAVMLFVAASGP